MDVNGNNLTGFDEIAFNNAAANPTAAGRLRRNVGRLVWGYEDTRTNSVVEAFVIQATTSGVPANGIGVGLVWRAESGDEAPSDFGRVDFAASDITAGSEDTYMDVLVRVAGAALAAIYRFQATGAFRGIFTHANTADRTYTLSNINETFSGIIDRDVVSIEVVNTAVETTAYTFVIPANILGTTRAIRWTLIGDYLNNTGVDRTFQVRVSYGATAFFDSGAITVTTNAQRRALTVKGTLSAANATNVQYSECQMILENPNTVTGQASTGTDKSTLMAVHNAGAIDSTAALSFSITFQHSVANASLSAKAFAVQLELL